MPYAVRRSYLRARRAVIRHRASAGRRLAVALAVAAAAAGICAAWSASRRPPCPRSCSSRRLQPRDRGTEARWRLYGWRTPVASAEIAWPEPVRPGSEKLSFDIIVPLRDEANVIGETLRGLLRQTHPRYHIVVSLCDDDTSTINAVRAVVRENLLANNITIIADHYANPTKAQQLNRALKVCMGDVIGVIDAEDDVAKDLLVHAEALLSRSGADVVQGGVQLMNLGSGLGKWFQVHNVLEYFFWFTSRMAFHVEHRLRAAGRRTASLSGARCSKGAGGWPLSITEDCALGVRLSTEFGAKVATAYSALSHDARGGAAVHIQQGNGLAVLAAGPLGPRVHRGVPGWAAG